MFKSKVLTIIIGATFALACLVTSTMAQTATTFVTGLQSPTKIIYSPRCDCFFVSEAGSNGTINAGRISVVTNDGAVFQLINGLPSGPAPPSNDPSGPSAMWLNDNSLYIALGTGNSTIAGPAQGSEIPNPSPASPIFSSVLELKLPQYGRLSRRAYQLLPTDYARLANGETVIFGFGVSRATLRLMANFPDYTPNPRPGVPDNVRNSNPFGLAGAGIKLYVADAAQNQIRTVNLLNGNIETFFNYPSRVNPLPGPPMVEPVPDGVRLFGNKLLVTFLTGFPFPAGVSDVRQIDLETGAESQLIGGLTTAIDVLPVSNGFCHSFYTLEISTNLAGNAPGRVQRFDSPTGQPTLVNNTLVSPTSFARHPSSGDLLVTEIFPGRITRISNP